MSGGDDEKDGNKMKQDDVCMGMNEESANYYGSLVVLQVIRDHITVERAIAQITDLYLSDDIYDPATTSWGSVAKALADSVTFMGGAFACDEAIEILREEQEHVDVYRCAVEWMEALADFQGISSDHLNYLFRNDMFDVIQGDDQDKREAVLRVVRNA